MLGLSETIDKLRCMMRTSVYWYGHGLRRVDGYVLRMAFGFEVSDQGNKGRMNRT